MEWPRATRMKRRIIQTNIFQKQLARTNCRHPDCLPDARAALPPVGHRDSLSLSKQGGLFEFRSGSEWEPMDIRARKKTNLDSGHPLKRPLEANQGNKASDAGRKQNIIC